MDAFITASFLSLAANRIIEAVVAPVKLKFPKLDLWWLMYMTWMLGGALAYVSGLNLFAAPLPGLAPVVGQVLTALVVGGGSNLLHDVFQRKA